LSVVSWQLAVGSWQLAVKNLIFSALTTDNWSLPTV
jgi:hypothetical protein